MLNTKSNNTNTTFISCVVKCLRMVYSHNKLSYHAGTSNRAEVRLHSNCKKAKRNENMDVKIGDKLLIFSCVVVPEHSICFITFKYCVTDATQICTNSWTPEVVENLWLEHGNWLCVLWDCAKGSLVTIFTRWWDYHSFSIQILE